MKSKSTLILALIFLSSCVDRSTYLLPKEYRLVQIQQITSFPERIKVYEIAGDYISYAKIQNYPNYKNIEGYSLQKWVKFEELGENDRTHITMVVKELSERIDKESKSFNKTTNIRCNKEGVYFSGIFTEAKSSGSRAYHFYHTFNILDVNKNRLYQIQHIKDY